MRTVAVEKVSGCAVENLQIEKTELTFVRQDVGLPINFGLFGALNFRFVPVHRELNRYMVTVRGLPPGEYVLTVDERGVGSYRHDQLARGVNAASATRNGWQPGGPWDAQATVLQSVTQARSRLGVAALLWDSHLRGSGDRPVIDQRVAKLDSQLRALQRTIAQPMPYRFRIRRGE